MESQVRVLELEAELSRERWVIFLIFSKFRVFSKLKKIFIRLRFAALRKQHFHIAQLVSSQENGGGNGEVKITTDSTPPSSES